MPVLPHRVCVNCGYYRGRQVVKLKSKLTGRARARAEAAKAKTEKKEGKSE